MLPPPPPKPVVFAPKGAAATPAVKKKGHQSAVLAKRSGLASRGSAIEEGGGAPLVWHSMNVSDPHRKVMLSHVVDDGGRGGPMSLLAPLVDFGERKGAAVVAEGKESPPEMSASPLESPSGEDAPAPWPSVSLLVWAEDGVDELRADGGQVEALWRAVQRSDAFVALDECRGPWFSAPQHRYSGEPAKARVLARRKAKTKAKNKEAGKDGHISSLAPYNALTKSKAGGGDGSGDGTGDGSGGGGGGDGPDGDDTSDGDRARGSQPLRRAKGLFVPAPQERGFGRAIPAEMVVVTTGGLKASKKAPESLANRLARSDLGGRLSLRVHEIKARPAGASPLAFSEVANWAALFCHGDLLVFLRPNVVPLRGWLSAMLGVDALLGSGSRLVGPVVLYPSGRIFSAGLEYHDTPIMNPAEARTLAAAARASPQPTTAGTGASGGDHHHSGGDDDNDAAPSIVLPHQRLRGYHARDGRLGAAADAGGDSSGGDGGAGALAAQGVARHCLMVGRATFFELNGFSPDLTGALEDADLALRLALRLDLAADHNGQASRQAGEGGDQGDQSSAAFVATGGRVVAMNPEGYPELDSAYASQMFDFRAGVDRERLSDSRAAFVGRWGRRLAARLASGRLTSARLTWVVHCGGSQGYEAATILAGLEPLAATRMIVRRYRECEHTDTLGGTPGAFRDSFDRAATRRFSGPAATPRVLLGAEAAKVLAARQVATLTRHGARNGFGNTSAASSSSLLASSTVGVGADGTLAEGYDPIAHFLALEDEYRAAAAAAAAAEAKEEASARAAAKAALDSLNGHAKAVAAAKAAGVLAKAKASVGAAPPPAGSEAIGGHAWGHEADTWRPTWHTAANVSANSAGSALAASAANGVTVESHGARGGAGSIALYARDYREAGRWVPRDAAYVVGRYMFEAAILPGAWVEHCNRLDEVWVPSGWQAEAFAASGVERAKLVVMPEALDVWHYDPSPLVTAPLALPGTVLDGLPVGDPRRPFVFLSVFKLEDRKGWRELCKAFMLEFEGSQDPVSRRDRVVLLLRTYVHVEGQGFVYSKEKVMAKVVRYLSKTIGYHPDSSRQWPKVEVVQDHLPAHAMPGLYANADAFVLPTHGEGWGLPTMEAMAMGLPVITTDWGGSTAFVDATVAYPIDIDGVVSTQQTLDSPYKNNKWAQPSARHLRKLMRRVVEDLTDSATGQVLHNTFERRGARDPADPLRPPPAPLGVPHSAALGVNARRRIVTHYRPEVVASAYARRLDEIHAGLQRSAASADSTPASAAGVVPRLRAAGEAAADEYHGDRVASGLDSTWQLSDSFKACAVGSRPFRLGSLPPGHPAKAPLGPGTAAFGSSGDGSAGAGGGNLCHVAILSTYVPRECGIAIFTERLVHALEGVCGAGARIEVIPVKHKDMAIDEYNRSTVKVAIREWELDDYLAAAQYVNREGFGLVLLQYEFGIWPVAHALCFARAVKTRLITTIHTVARTYASEEYHTYVAQLSVVSHRLTVMTELMRWTLDAFHGVPPHRVGVIPHGVPDRPLRRTAGTHRQLVYAGRKVIMTNGLMHGYKGIEYMIEAMPAVLARHPDALYLVEGKPHPGGWGVQGYYAGLKKRATELGLMGTSVVFNNAFAEYEELLTKLEAAMVYVNPYTDTTQSVSGTVAMALAAGCAIVSTPYPYALDALGGGVGVFVPFRDSASLAATIADLLDDPIRIAAHNLRAHAYAANMTWAKVAAAHLNLARSIADD